MSKYKYLFGPVPSRRLGRSLGVDIIPLKVCSQNCIYCQLGINADTVVARDEYVKVDEVLAELKDAVDNGLEADYITLTGSGEPTLNSRIGDLIQGIHQITNIPIALITNATLLGDEQVQKDCRDADVVLPSLDAGDAEAFKKMNRPHASINFDDFVEGLISFRKVHTGQIWLEVFCCQNVNVSDSQVEKMRAIIERIGPDRIQLNTSIRPTVEKDAVRVPQQRMEEIADMLGSKAEVVADYSKLKNWISKDASTEKVLELLKRRPCTLEDICNGLSADRNHAAKIISLLNADNAIQSEQKNEAVYYSVKV